MIIKCPNCEKKFKIDASLIPEDGRELQCGACDNIWFYKPTIDTNEPLTLNEDISYNEIVPEKGLDKDNKIIKKSQNTNKIKSKIKEQENNEIKERKETFDHEKKPRNSGSRFFSYLIVAIISLFALIILLDTLKTSLIDIFPGLEILLFNLYETLQDIKLFIIDLS